MAENEVEFQNIQQEEPDHDDTYSEPDPAQIQRSNQAHPQVLALSEMQDTVEQRYDLDKLLIESLVHSIENGDVEAVNVKVNRVTSSLTHSTIQIKQCLQKAENTLADSVDENKYVWRKLEDFREMKRELEKVKEENKALKEKVENTVHRERFVDIQQKLSVEHAQCLKLKKRSSNLAKGLVKRDRQIKKLEAEITKKDEELQKLFDYDFSAEEDSKQQKSPESKNEESKADEKDDDMITEEEALEQLAD